MWPSLANLQAHVYISRQIDLLRTIHRAVFTTEWKNWSRQSKNSVFRTNHQCTNCKHRNIMTVSRALEDTFKGEAKVVKLWQESVCNYKMLLLSLRNNSEWKMKMWKMLFLKIQDIQRIGKRLICKEYIIKMLNNVLKKLLFMVFWRIHEVTV